MAILLKTLRALADTRTQSERLIARAPPSLNCVLFLLGLIVGVDVLVPHLAWYGLPHAMPHAAMERWFMRTAAWIGVIALVGVASPGNPRRRVFAACAFALLGLLAMVSTSVGLAFTHGISWPEYPNIEAVARGLALGLVIATVLSMPTAWLYRSSAVPVAILSILPAIAKAYASASPGPSGGLPQTFVCHTEAYLCALAVVGVSTYAFESVSNQT